MYSILKKILGLLLQQFFSEVKVRGAAPVENGAALIVVNHPNFALDSLLVATSFKRDLWFIAKATLFTNTILEKFFTSCHMLPINRKQDALLDQIDNSQNFVKVVSKLTTNQAIVIFPEGVSLGERKILPIKTGAARIAFEAEESRGFNLNLVIQAVGLTYSKLDSFKSTVTITFAEPIKVSTFKSEYESDAINAVKTLTEHIESELKSVTVNIEKAEQIDLVEKISAIYRSKGESSDDHKLMSAIALNLKQLNDEQLAEKKGLIERINVYSELASIFGIDGNYTFDKTLNKLIMFTSLPFFFLGYLINILPYRLVGILVNKPEVHKVFMASSKFGFGILIFLSWYLLLSICAAIYAKSILSFILVLTICMLSGFIINKYLNHLNLFIISNFWPVKKKPVELLQMIRNDLITEINSLRMH